MPFGYMCFFSNEGRTISYFVFELFFFVFFLYNTIWYCTTLLFSFSIFLVYFVISSNRLDCLYKCKSRGRRVWRRRCCCFGCYVFGYIKNGVHFWCAFHTHYASFIPSMYIINSVRPPSTVIRIQLCVFFSFSSSFSI